MTFTSTFYNGSVDEITWSEGVPRVGSAAYGVVGANDLKVTAVSGQDRTVSIAAGKCWGKGVHDTHSPSETIGLPSVSSGSRWDLIAVRRVWSTNTTSVVRIGGSATRVIPSGRSVGYGTTDDQPLALVRVQAGSTAIQEIVDLRCWAGIGGSIASDELAMSYLAAPGARVFINDADWVCTIVSGATSWNQTTFLGAIPLFGAGGPAPGQGSIPMPVAGTTFPMFRMVAGHLRQGTDANGYLKITWPKPFPNACLMAICQNGDDDLWAGMTLGAAGAAWGTQPLNKSYGVFVPKQSYGGTFNVKHPNTQVKVNYFAIGW